ncbi:hypothetical protein BLNAU_13843 [Blattamonas nauphoetae]|uniref:Uncharacterized protein n=1 Tax=Blattamonas nauphoetae TaxID=2049346 RepID=A0ABQ9XIM2_9EUKA|nr:hypothetical protein BLNAU_13843 [Blattamonas nauphoetae]
MALFDVSQMPELTQLLESKDAISRETGMKSLISIMETVVENRSSLPLSQVHLALRCLAMISEAGEKDKRKDLWRTAPFTISYLLSTVSKEERSSQYFIANHLARSVFPSQHNQVAKQLCTGIGVVLPYLQSTPKTILCLGLVDVDGRSPFRRLHHHSHTYSLYSEHTNKQQRSIVDYSERVDLVEQFLSLRRSPQFIGHSCQDSAGDLSHTVDVSCSDRCDNRGQRDFEEATVFGSCVERYVGSVLVQGWCGRNCRLALPLAAHAFLTHFCC